MQILIFIGLKIVEILGIVFIPYYIGKFINYSLDDDAVPAWMMGIAAIFGVAIVVLLGYVIVTVNWEFAGKLVN